MSIAQNPLPLSLDISIEDAQAAIQDLQNLVRNIGQEVNDENLQKMYNRIKDQSRS